MSRRNFYIPSDYKKLVDKGIKQLYNYLNEINNEDNILNDETKKKLFKVIGEDFREKMANDDKFFDEVEAFLFLRSTKDEKNKFYFKIMKYLCKKNNIKKRYARKFPNEYRLPGEDSMGMSEWFD